MSLATESWPLVTPEKIDISHPHLLPTEESLEWHYGHLSPTEIMQSALNNRQRARIAQLQMLAIREVVAIGTEYSDWLAVYGAAIGPSDGI